MPAMPTAVATRETAATRRSRTVLKYVPLTGPEPEDLHPGETFCHRGVRLDATLAQQLLDVNASFNRKESLAQAEAWAEQILNGDWDKPSPQGMVVSWDGELIDGQTRCRAVLIAAKTRKDVWIPQYIEHNWDRAVFAKLDSGRKRSTGQLLKEPNGHNHAANISLYFKFMRMYQDPPIDYTGWRRTQAPTTERVMRFLEANPDMRASFGLAKPLKTQARLNQSAATVAVFLLRQKANGDPVAIAVIHEFINGIADLRRCKDMDPRWALNRWADKADRSDRKIPQSEPLGLILRAWERWCQGERVQTFIWEHGKSRMPDVFVPKDWAEVPRKWGIQLPLPTSEAA